MPAQTQNNQYNSQNNRFYQSTVKPEVIRPIQLISQPIIIEEVPASTAVETWNSIQM